ncbi:tetratricopeptide repeat protein 16-like [Engraulis encrasicolus]|uniref:tetratricopeptide repeat protein 16-like n=1 Tax=Engraulis encrasicolus TaxID=184585 RepID=UPI002FD4E4C1
MEDLNLLKEFVSYSTTVADNQQTHLEDATPSIFGSSSIFRCTGPKAERPDLSCDLIIKNRVESLLKSGHEAMSKSEFEKAVACFNKAITLKPNEVQLHADVAEARLKLNDFQAAINSYSEACRLSPEDKTFLHRLAYVYHLQGQSLFDKGMFVGALESFTKASELRPDFRSYQYKSLACLTALGRYSDSLKLVTRWLETDEQTADLFVLKARLHKQLNQMSLCHHSLKSALRLNPSCPEGLGLQAVLREVGEVLRRQAGTKALEGNLQQALVRINSAVQSCPEEPSYYLFRGTLQRRLKDFTTAIKDLVAAIELCEAQQASAAAATATTSASATTLRGPAASSTTIELCEAQQASAAAATATAAATSASTILGGPAASPSSSTTIEPCGAQQASTAPATDVTNSTRGGKITPASSSSSSAAVSLGEITATLGRETDAAISATTSAYSLAATPDERQEGSVAVQEEAHLQLVLTYNDFALHCFSHGCYKEAAMLLSRAIEDYRDESGLFINRGDCFFKQGDLCFALADYQQAEELDPHNRAIHARLAVTHNSLGMQSQANRQFQEALEHFSQAVKYNPGVSQYYENRGRIYNREQKLEEAKEDAIHAILLDPTNRQVEALLLSLFPGSSLSQVLRCDMVQTLRSQLAARIDASKQTVTPVSRLADSLEGLKILDGTECQSEGIRGDSVNVDQQADASKA